MNPTDWRIEYAKLDGTIRDYCRELLHEATEYRNQSCLPGSSLDITNKSAASMLESIVLELGKLLRQPGDNASVQFNAALDALQRLGSNPYPEDGETLACTLCGGLWSARTNEAEHSANCIWLIAKGWAAPES